MRRWLSVIATALLAVLMVLLLPSTAWSVTTNAPPSFVVITQYMETQTSIAFHFEIDSGSTHRYGGNSQHADGCRNASNANASATVTVNNFVTRAGRPSYEYYGGDVTITCPSGYTLVNGRSAMGMNFATQGGSFVSTWEVGPGSYVPPIPPKEESVCSDRFKAIRTAVVDGTLDISWKWEGGLPSRGWKLRAAGPSAAAGVGTQVALVPLSPQPLAGRYGLTAVTLTSSMPGLRAEVSGKPSCFFQMALTFDASGNLTGVLPVADGSEITPDVDPTEDGDVDAEDCGVLDLICFAEYLFIPRRDFGADFQELEDHIMESFVFGSVPILTTIMLDLHDQMAGCENGGPGCYVDNFGVELFGKRTDVLTTAGANDPSTPVGFLRHHREAIEFGFIVVFLLRMVRITEKSTVEGGIGK